MTEYVIGSTKSMPLSYMLEIGRILVAPQISYEVINDRIQMNVSRDVNELLIIFNPYCLEASLKKWTYSSVFRIEVLRVAVCQFAYERRYATLLKLPKQEVEMGRHETEANDFY